MQISSERLTLERITPQLAARILVRDERPGDGWHPEYPFADELGPLKRLAAEPASESPFTMYVVRENQSGLAIGGFGFFGPPDDEGRIGFGYGLIGAARGRGYATEGVIAALDFARANGALHARADTASDNLASQRVLEKAGLVLVRRSESDHFYERAL